LCVHMIVPLVQGCTVWKNEGIHPVKLLVMVLS
jgi:hypothetical protein